MKKAIIIFFLIFNTNIIYSQNVEELIQLLYSDETWENIAAVDEIIYFNFTDAYPHISGLYNSKPPIVQHSFLEALCLFEDSLLYDRLLDYINRADSFIIEEFSLNPLTEKVYATSLLFTIDQFQTYNYVFELIERDGINNLSPTTFNSLDIIMNDIPEAENQAKNILISIWETSSNDNYRSMSQFILVQKYGAVMLDKLLTSFVEDEYLPTRVSALEYLFIFNYAELNSLLKTRLILEPSSPFRRDIADSLLTSFGEPSDLKAVIDYQPNEPNETSRSLMDYSISHFIPPKPDTLDWIGLTTKLISYTDEMLQYGWIANQQTKDFYSSRLADIISLINQTNQIDSVCTIINNQLLPQAEQDLQQELITTEGYKFLHYYTVYIKEEIEEEFGPCP